MRFHVENIKAEKQDYVNLLRKIEFVLKDELRQLNQNLEDHQVLLAIAPRLPSEILLLIFEEYVRTAVRLSTTSKITDNGYGASNSKFCEAGGPWILAQVSRRWRAVALDVPSLWAAAFGIAASNEGLQAVPPTDILLKQSRDLPLSLYHKYGGHQSCSDTWRVHRLTVHVPAPSLLETHGQRGDLPLTPWLQTLDITLHHRLLAYDEEEGIYFSSSLLDPYAQCKDLRTLKITGASSNPPDAGFALIMDPTMDDALGSPSFLAGSSTPDESCDGRHRHGVRRCRSPSSRGEAPGKPQAPAH